MRNREPGKIVGLCLAVVSVTLVFAATLACATPQPTSAPVPPAAPAQPVAPTPLATTIPVLAPPTPTSVTAAPTPTRALPTPTPAVLDKPQYGGTLTYGTRSGVDTLDPAYTVQFTTFDIMGAVNDQLFRLDALGKVIPGLAEAWEFSADGKVVTLRLRKDVKFHDGTQFNSATVKWNLDRILDPKALSPHRGQLEKVQEVRALGEYDLSLHLKAPYRPLLNTLASERSAFQVSPSAVAKYGGGQGGNYGRNPVGTGPFRFVEWVPEDRVVLRRADGYWEAGKPYLDAIRILIVPDSDIRMAMLRTDEVQILYPGEVSPRYVPLIERSPTLRLERLPGALIDLLQFNIIKPPYDNKALRLAIAHAIDREKFVKVNFLGTGEPSFTAIGVGWARNPDLKPVPFDLNKTRQYLAQAGYPTQGARVPIGCPSTGGYFERCETHLALLREAGFVPDVTVILAADYFSATAGFRARIGFGTTAFAWRGEPALMVNYMGHSKDGYPALLGWPPNPTLDSLIDEAGAVYDVAKAKPLYDRIQTIMAEEAYYVFTAWGDRLTARSNALQGFFFRPDGWIRFDALWLRK